MKIFEEEVMKEPEEDKAKRTADELIDEYEKKIHETI
jgi:ribosomal protein S17E